MQKNCAVLFSKPAEAGRVKTRLIGALSPQEAAELHQAFLGDVLESLKGGGYDLQIAWALESGEAPPKFPEAEGVASFRQATGNLGDRLLKGLQNVALNHEFVVALGSDHPELKTVMVEKGFQFLESADVVLGPTADGGYYLIGMRRTALKPELFEGISWSTETVLEETLERCVALNLRTKLLPEGRDIDVAEDLHALIRRLQREPTGCPRTRVLLRSWGRLKDTAGLKGKR